MKSKKLATALGLGAITLSVLGTQLFTTVAAATPDDANVSAVQNEQSPPNDFGAPNDADRPNDMNGQNDRGGQSNDRQGRQDKPQLKDVTRTVTNLANGVEVTCTSTDADTVAKLQSLKQPEAPKNADGKVTVTRSNIANGIKTTITSSDADTVKKIQEHEKFAHRPGNNGQNGQGKNHVDLSKVKYAAQNIEKGATITLTSDDAATVTKIQEFAKNFKLPPPGHRPGQGPRMGGQGMGQSRQSRQGVQNGPQGQQQGQNDNQGPQFGGQGGQFNG